MYRVHIREPRLATSSFLFTGTALAVCLVISFVLNGLPVILTSAVVLATSFLVEFVASKICRRALRQDFVIYGLILSLTVSPEIPLWMAASATAFAQIIFKELLGSSGRSTVNSAAVALAILIAIPPHNAFAFPLGGWPLIALAVCALVLMFSGAASWKIMLPALLCIIPHSNLMLENGFPFVAIFMLTEPFNAPRGEGSKWLFGLLFGLVTIAIEMYLPYFSGSAVAALLVAEGFARLADCLAVRRNIRRRLSRGVTITPKSAASVVAQEPAAEPAAPTPVEKPKEKVMAPSPVEKPQEPVPEPESQPVVETVEEPESQPVVETVEEHESQPVTEPVAETTAVPARKCEVVCNRNLAPLFKELWLKVMDGDFRYKPGDYINIHVPVCTVRFADIPVDKMYIPSWKSLGISSLEMKNAEPITREYTMASCMCEKAEGGETLLKFIIRLALPPQDQPEANPGICSSYLFSLKPGDTVEIDGPCQEMAPLDEPDVAPEDSAESERELVFVAGGAGISLIRSLLLHQLAVRGTSRKISFYYGSRDFESVLLYDEMNSLQERYPNFSLHLTLDVPDMAAIMRGIPFSDGRVTTVLKNEYLAENPAAEDALYLACGPEPMIDSLRAVLDEAGVPKENLIVNDL